MSDDLAKGALADVGVALDGEALRVHAHVHAPDDLACTEREDVEEGVDEDAGTVAKLGESQGRGRETENVGGAKARGERLLTDETQTSTYIR